MDIHAEGDLAVKTFADYLKIVAASSENFETKIKIISETLVKAMEPWNLKGDDRVLSMMNGSAGECAEKLAHMEMTRITGNKKVKAAGRIAALDALDKSVSSIQWLAKGFKSSIKCDIAFAKSDVRALG